MSRLNVIAPPPSGRLKKQFLSLLHQKSEVSEHHFSFNLANSGKKGILKTAIAFCYRFKIIYYLAEQAYYQVEVEAVELFARLKCLFFRIGRTTFRMVQITSF